MKQAKRHNLSMLAIGLMIVGISLASAQHMNDDHQVQSGMNGIQPIQQSQENVQHSLTKRSKAVINVDVQGMMSIDDMMDQIGQMMNHGAAMQAAMESNGSGRLLNLFSSGDTDSHMLDMTQGMTEMMANMQGMMDNIQGMLHDKSIMNNPGIQPEMDNIQMVLWEMVKSLDALMENIHNIEKINPTVSNTN